MKSLAKVFTLTKNEYDLIEDFIRFYGSIFGFDNIVIIDNGSDVRTVLEVYQKYIVKGVVVHRDTRPMTEMADIMTEYISMYKDQMEFALPIDTDEFMFVVPEMKKEDYIIDKAAILDYLKNIDKSISVVKYPMFLGSLVDPSHVDICLTHKYNRPALGISEFHDQGWDKVIVRANKFVSIGAGNHNVAVSGGKTITGDFIGLLHYHNTGARRELERCIQSIKGYRQFDIGLAIDAQMLVGPAYIDGVGGHRVKQYLNFVKRIFIINKFLDLVKRPPIAEEMQEHFDTDNIFMIYTDIYNKKEKYKDKALCPFDYDTHVNALIFTQDKQVYDKKYTVKHVQNYLRCINNGTLA